MTNEKLQATHCDMSRNTNKAPKILKNIGGVCHHFPIDEPILCVGCGDGLEIDIWKSIGFKSVSGIDLDSEKVEIANNCNCDVRKLSVEEHTNTFGIRNNIYCAHVLEHCQDVKVVLEKFKKIALSTICVIIPIEKNVTKNPSHLSPVRSVADLSIKGWRVVRMYENFNYELQGIVVWKRI